MSATNHENVISEEMMTSGEEFLFGKGYIHKSKTYSWSADRRDTQNGHMLIVGGSGSGKTRLLKKIISHLYQKDKQVYVIDFHGDMQTENETCYKFSLRNSEFGINPFEMELDKDNGGPNAQVGIILANFKKNFIQNMGAVQKTVFRHFLINCYRYVGILDEDESTWTKPLPTVSIMIELYEKISRIIKSGSGHGIYEHLERISKIQRECIIETNTENGPLLQNRVASELSRLNVTISLYNQYLNEGKHEEMFNIHIAPYVDTEFYLDPANSKAFASLFPYLHELNASSVFNDNKPPKAKGVVRYDISGFTNTDKPSEAMFFADTVIQKIFRAVKMRGEYRKLGKRGKADTFVVIDESKLILPTGKDKENPYNILNRIVTESRKFGMALIIVSQRPEHFPEEMLSSIYTKIVLRINENDVKAAANSLGVKDHSLFKHLNYKNVALVGYTGGLFESVELAYAS